MVLLDLIRSQSPLRQFLLAAAAGSVSYQLYKKLTYVSPIEAEEQAILKRMENMPQDSSKQKVAVNAEFFKRLRMLIGIVLPSVRCKEFFILLLHTSFLISRTLVSIYVAKLDGSIVKSIVDRKLKLFVWLMCKWIMIAVPATYINSMIQYLENKLSIAFRSRLVKHVYEMYMKDETYYRIGNLDSRLSNPDQCLTEDVQAFCSDLAHLYSHLSKPCLDVVLMTTQLILLSRQRGGGKGHSGAPLLLATAVIVGTGYILKLATPPFGKLIAEQARRYGELRAAHSRVITHSEEIAFYGGHEQELSVLQRTYDDLIKHVNYIYRKKIFYTMLEQFLMRYIWGACGMIMIAIPAFYRYHESLTASISQATEAVLAADTDNDNVSTRTQDFVTSRGLLISAADAIERMMSSWKEITELAGRTARISEMIEIFEQVQRGQYVKKQLNAEIVVLNDDGSDVIDELDEDSKLDVEEKETPRDTLSPVKLIRNVSRGAPSPNTRSIEGQVIDNSPFVELKNVPIFTPNGDSLIQDPGLSFRIEKGMHLLITGPNGCGKSSLFRMLGGLWPTRGGILYRPGKGHMFYIPQRPYLTKGTFREQFIYPDTEADFKRKGKTDADLRQLLDIVALASVVEREGGLDSTNEWRDVLSGGEKQRVAMARLFYWSPEYAILDECTSAVSIDVEGRMYAAAIEHGITLLTVTHRPSLWKYHTHLLQFDGHGHYSFSALNADTRLSLHDEKAKLELQLQNVPSSMKRLKELCDILGEQSLHLLKNKQ